MRAITRMDVQSWIRSLVEKGAGPAAIKRAYNLTSSIMRAAVDDDVIAVSPCRSIDLPPIAVKPPQWFTPDQAQSILDGLAPAWRTMCLLGFYTGLRWGELSGLHRHRIDTRRSRLFVVEVNTKSGIKEYPKSSKSRREVPLPPHVLEGPSNGTSTGSTATQWSSRPSPRAVPDASSPIATGAGRPGGRLSRLPTISATTASCSSSRTTRRTPCATPALRGWSRRGSRSTKSSTFSATRASKPPSATPISSRTRTRPSSEPGSGWKPRSLSLNERLRPCPRRTGAKAFTS